MNIVFATIITGVCSFLQAPHQLKTDLMTDTRTVCSNGYPTSTTLEQVVNSWKRGNTNTYQVALIHTPHPKLSWELPTGVGQQQSYRILMASSLELLKEGKADIWDNHEVANTTSNGITCKAGLIPSTIYYWTVKIRDNKGNCSPYAAPQAFLTAAQWNEDFPRYSLRKKDQKPVTFTESRAGNWFADFGKDAFSQLTLTVESQVADTLIVHLGEACKDGEVDRKPGAAVRYTMYRIPVHVGIDTYKISFRPDRRNAVIKPHGKAVRPVLMPEYIGEVYPFRYCQVESKKARLLALQRQMVHYPWNPNASYFHSSDSVLNKIWDLCKYSILATSYTGVYVDGDRERIPYEADALINQLSHYSVDQEYTMARYSVDYLCHNATWPTEWILQAPLMAWNDYLYTGDASLLQKDYEILKARTLQDLKEKNGLISTRTGKQTTELLRRCGFYGRKINDIVDWPRKGAVGVGKEKPGEADGYELTDYNTVVNSFHYQALRLMGNIADALGRKEEADSFRLEAVEVREAINRLLFDKRSGCYRDGIGSDHHSLHASMFPMAFGIVHDRYRKQVLEYIKSRGMACSVYGAQFLLEALYDGGLQDYALQLLTSKGERSWWNMLRKGSTITTEAWDRQFKPNTDWNHAWGAAPANIIPRKLMGIEPLEPGWKRMRIQPQPGILKTAEIRVPTILGTVQVSFVRTSGAFQLHTVIPSGTVAEVVLPCSGRSCRLTINGKVVRGVQRNNTLSVELPTGTYQLVLK